MEGAFGRTHARDIAGQRTKLVEVNRYGNGMHKANYPQPPADKDATELMDEETRSGGKRCCVVVGPCSVGRLDETVAKW